MNTPYTTYLGNPQCNCMEVSRYKAVLLVAQSIYHDFEYALDRKLQIGDMSPLVGNCPGHPGSSHGKKISMDINYYTYLSGVGTQYSSDEFKRIQMWENPGYVLKSGIFDWERNFVFSARLCQLLPESRISVNSILMNMMIENAKSEYGIEVANIPKFTEDTGITYNHHIHAHIDLSEVNVNFRVSEFIAAS